MGSDNPHPGADAWDDVNLLRKALIVNSRGYLATSAALLIGACFLVSIVVGAGLAMPVIALIAAYDQVHKFIANRVASKKTVSDLRLVTGSEGE
jgi:hypothetical protein